MARILIVGGGCRGRALARELAADANAVRISTRSEAGRAAIEQAGAECWVGTPDAIGSLRYALENVTLLCWLLGTATGPPESVAALHGTRLEMMLSNTIDTTVRGIIYEGKGDVDDDVLAAGAATVARLAERNEIPYAILEASPDDTEAWMTDAQASVARLLALPRG